MRSYPKRNRFFRAVSLILLAAVSAVPLLLAENAWPAERQFLVILADSPKDGGPPLPSPELIRRQYFDKTDPNIGSFAEFWKEISYGDVTVAGRVTDWILLPWPISLPFTFVDLNGFGYQYGSGEAFTTSEVMVGIDIGLPITHPGYYARGGQQTTTNGAPVWTPGERFFDINGDGVWNGIDEAGNTMDWRNNASPGSPADGKPDLRGPWVDLNGNGVPNNDSGCVYLNDSDNDGNPDCCPNGPGKPGCEGLRPITDPAAEPDPKLCPSTRLPGGASANLNDCNGNQIPDACDISCTSQNCLSTGWTDTTHCGTSKDQLPYAAQGNDCAPGPGDGIPDECQFLDAGRPCVATAPSCDDPENPDVCCTVPTVCQLLPARLSRATVVRCEFDDRNGNRALDMVEPFENYFRGVPSVPNSSEYDQYIRHNFPGSDPDAVVARSIGRQLGGAHDPLGKLTAARDKVCADGLPYRAIGTQTDVCPAGEHVQYDPPDAWLESNSSKMVIGNSTTSTPKPTWYEQAWSDRFNNADPPPWVSSVGATLFDPRTAPLNFLPNRGGLNGDGTGWIGDIQDDTPVLPDQLNGVDNSVIFFDGLVEHDDLPSSKYHMDGDQFPGEVTSPFSPSIAGDDRGTNDPNSIQPPDGIIPAAGPYATRLHGQNGRDGGNQLNIEVLTWRTAPPANDGEVWESRYGGHPYAGPSGANLGFRDYNLDGWLDMGEVRTPGAESYTGIFGNDVHSPRGNAQRRIVEDSVQVLDETLDFDSYVDQIVLDTVACYNPAVGSAVPPPPYTVEGPQTVAGLLSGIVLLAPSSPAVSPFVQDVNLFFHSIHNEDGLGDAAYQASGFPDANPLVSKINWNIRFHTLVHTLGTGFGAGAEGTNFATPYAAEMYGLVWQLWPDTEDYDQYDGSGVVNCPIGGWDLMTNEGGLVHPIPPHKEAKCTEWIKTVDLTSILTPGVDKSITFPSAEFVRDDSFYFLENEDRPREKLYFWSAGNGFDRNMPGPGLLILHADPTGSNNDAIVLQQRSGLRPAYRIIQADGLHELEAGPGLDAACGDVGDPFPGAINQMNFDCSTQPASQWYTDEACTGLEIHDVIPDGAGGTRVTFNWTPTSIPSLKFIDPPGGVSVGSSYQIRTEVNDVFGGTSIRFYYKKHETGTPEFTGSTFISPQKKKTTSGPNELSINWNVAAIPDGRYVIFADLIPGIGADGTEAKLTRPRAGRNNLGTAKLETSDVIVNVTTISGTTVVTQGTSRSETWVAECVDANAGKWLVGSSLTQPLPPEEPSAATCTTFPTRCATTGTQYTSLAGAVKFTIRNGTGASPKGAVGDTFTFTTTGITAPSEAVTISNGQIREDPTAIIDASPLSGPPPLEVDFDARRSVDPNGQPLTFQWTFCRPGTCGAGETATGPQVSHTYPTGGLYTVTLKATNPANGRFGETSVDIQVTNNSPNAVIKAAPTSGPEPLEVRFDATQSRDTETAPEELIYQWNYGNGLGANDGGLAGISFAQVTHTYSRVNTNLDTTNCTATCPCTPTGRACTAVCPCAFTAVLTVTDAGGKKDTDSAVIRVGNTNPTAKITTIPTLLQGLNPFTVTFNAKESSDAEGDNLEVEWQWGDGSANEKWPAKTGKPPAVDGGVPHTFTLPAGTTFKTYTVKAIVRDLNANGTLKGGETTSQLVVTVFTEGAQPPQANRPPKAAFVVTPPEAFEGEEVTFDAGLSSDPDEPSGDVLRYRWTFGDGSPLPPFTTNPVATHTYASVGTYVVRLTVRDKANASSESTQTVRVLLEGANRSPVAMIATGPRTGSAPLTLTLDGSISFDPDGDVITSYSWEFGQDDVLVETVDTGSVPEVTRVFATPGEYTVVLVVKTGVDGAEGRTAPESILVTDPAAPPPPEPPPPRPEPQEPPNSAAQRPLPSTCGFGVLMGSLVSLLGLTLTAVTRRRLRT